MTRVLQEIMENSSIFGDMFPSFKMTGFLQVTWMTPMDESQIWISGWRRIDRKRRNIWVNKSNLCDSLD
jgi:hypothetical protein